MLLLLFVFCPWLFMYSREGKFLIRLAVGVVLAAVLLALAVALWLPVLRPPVSGWVESEGFRPRAQVSPQHWFFLKDGSVVAGMLKSQDSEQAVVTAPWGSEIRIPQDALAGFTSSPLLVPGSDGDNPDADIREAILSTSPAKMCGITLVRLRDGGVFLGEVSGNDPEKLALRNRFLGVVEIPRRWVASVTEFAGKSASGPEQTARLPAEMSPASVELLPDGGILVADAEGDMVCEVGPDGTLLWKYRAGQPRYATRLPDGNTLVCAYGENRVIEVTREGETAWSQPAAGPVAARRLSTGRTLIAEKHKGRLIEVGPGGRDVWEGLANINDCLRLPDGNTLVVVCGEVCTLAKIDYTGRRLWRVSNLPRHASIIRATGQFIEIANPDRSQCVYIDQMGGIIFETFRRFEYDE